MPRRPREGVEVQLYTFLTSGPDGGLVVNTSPAALSPWERDPVPILQEVGGPRDRYAGNLAPIWIRDLNLPACNFFI